MEVDCIVAIVEDDRKVVTEDSLDEYTEEEAGPVLEVSDANVDPGVAYIEEDEEVDAIDDVDEELIEYSVKDNGIDEELDEFDNIGADRIDEGVEDT